MRISDWSSDVCSSDLKTLRHGHVIDAVSVGIRSVDIVERQLHAVVHVEPALRLADQAQIGIVDHDMQVRQLELRADRELLDHELEVVIAGNGDHLFAGAGRAYAQGGGHRPAQRACLPGVDPVARLVYMQELGRGDLGQADRADVARVRRSEEHTSELQSLMRISYAVFCLKKKKT